MELPLAVSVDRDTIRQILESEVKPTDPVGLWVARYVALGRAHLNLLDENRQLRFILAGIAGQAIDASGYARFPAPKESTTFLVRSSR
jgi:hypothetical protein